MDIQPGLTIICNNRKGTLGLLVKRNDNDDNIYLLSCWHILDDGIEHSEVTAPDLGGITIARYTRSTDTSSQEMDAAIAQLLPDLDIPAHNTIVGTDTVISQAAYWKKRMELKKLGATTGWTRSMLEKGKDYFGDLQYALILKKHPNGKMHYCDHGDSGALWCSATTGKGIAIHAKGGLAANKAAASPLVYILDKFNLSII